MLRSVLNLPTSVQERLAGPPVRRDGQELATETQLMLRLQEVVREPKVESLALAEARAAMTRQAGMVGGAQQIGEVRELSVAGAAGPRDARLYVPTALLGSGTPSPLLVYFHGGGMTYGDLDSHDAACRFLAEQATMRVLSVDYRLAPEHPFPAGVDDAAAAYRWTVEHVAELGADPARLAVGGDSAGGYLAATTALAAAEEGLPLAFQLLIYPVTEFREVSRSRDLFSDGFYLTKDFMDGCTAMFFADDADRDDDRASILRRDTLPEGLAPAHVVTAGFDPLRDEGEAYADRLQEHGVAVTRQRYPGLIHGFHNMVGCGRETVRANREVAAVLAQALRG